MQDAPGLSAPDAASQSSVLTGADAETETATQAPARRQFWGVVVEDRDCTYFDYYAGVGTEPVEPTAASAERVISRELPASISTGRETIDRDRKRDYTDTAFRGLAVRVRKQNAARLQADSEELLLTITNIASDAPLAVVGEARNMETRPLPPIGGLRETLERLDALAAQQVDACEALDELLTAQSALRNTILAGFIVAELSRLDGERTLILEELDGSVHYALHTLRADRELLEQELTPPQDATASAMFRIFERAVSGMSRASASKRLEEISTKLAAVTDRQRLLIERRDTLNADLERLRGLLTELGLRPETTMMAVHSRGIQQDMKAEEARRALRDSVLGTQRFAQDLLKLVDTRLIPFSQSLDEAWEQQSLEDVTRILSGFLPLAGKQFSPDQLRRLSHALTKFLGEVQSLVTGLADMKTGEGSADQALASVARDPESVLTEYARQVLGDSADSQPVHDEISRWFEAAKARIQSAPQDPMVAFAEFLESTGPEFVREPLAEEVRSLQETLRLSR